ncbi:olfactory receptor 11L1-like [Spea bombifrons]|uniref:olfactory receptor 11L1-like n=1 Tax=Spea bombifrons TaxID=233779 RepID=UPI0023494E94|nr:olfactory receptor 11L1-like [Spea bombifrons]
MCEDNKTEVIEFVLLGFQGLHNYRFLLFVVFLLLYVAILTGNLLIIILVTVTDHLHIPMFYFVKHLALAEVVVTTCVVPLMLDVIILEGRKISFVGCIVQLYVFGNSLSVQCLLLAVMSYDRYLAICNPLSYALIMVPNVCFFLVLGSWLLVFIMGLSEIFLLCQLHFCGRNDINHFFCDLGPLVELSTSDTSKLLMLDLIMSIPILFSPLVFIITTYILIFFTIVSIPSKVGREKFFSTCGPHLITVCTYYGTLIMVYMVQSGENFFNINKFRSLLYIVVIPLMNPIIYSFRNQELKAALRKVFIYLTVTH